MTAYSLDPACAARMDAEDPLAKWRDQFHIPPHGDGTPCIYLCGNSLGLQPVTARAAVMQELEDWQKLGVEGHFHAHNPWLPYHEFLAGPLARIAGAQPGEVVAANSLTVNLHLLMVSFYRPTRERYKILIEKDAFPSDRYAVDSQIRFHGFDPADALIALGPRPGEKLLRDEDILDLIAREGDSIALIMMGGVNYYTGQLFDMAAIAAAGHAKGCTIGFDLAHAAGNVPLRLHDWNVDFACWCSYKYLNSGPGSIGGFFVHERFARDSGLPRFCGWWGNDQETRFKMGPEFNPIPGAEGWQLSNPPILSLAAVKASLEIFDAAGMAALREKSLKLTSYLEYLLTQWCAEKIAIMTPKEPARRGCQLSLIAPGGRTAFEALMRAGVICDWREPDCIRIAPVPLYNSFSDVYRFARILAQEAA
jgi:kynureninase